MKRDDLDPLFRSGFEACRYAYAYSGQQFAMTPMARLARGEQVGSGRGLIGLEGAAVAGTVKRHVEALPAPLPAALVARHAVTREVALAAAAQLVEAVIPVLGTGGHHRHLIRALVCRYFKIPDDDGRPYQLSRLCDRFGLSADTMTRRWRATRERLREIDSRAEVMIDEALERAGLVG